MKLIDRGAMLAVLGMVAGCQQDQPASAPPAIPATRVVGAPQSCIPIVAIRTTRVRDDATIDFVGNGKQSWRNTLPNACPSLKSENRFTYATSLSQLCSTDIITVLIETGGSFQRGASCGFGQFVPVDLAPRDQ